MSKKLLFTIAIIMVFTNCYSQKYLFDTGWRFHRGGMQKAESPMYDDSCWRVVDLPHDWSIENLPGTDTPFDQYAVSQVSGGYTVGGTAWYRKTFSVPFAWENHHVVIQFDGVYMNSDIWVNGEYVGGHPYGYTSFWFDITNQIKPGNNNLIAVQVKNEGQNSRWYSGSGIYRHVWLKLMEPVHIGQWGIYITTPEVNAKQAKICIKTDIFNETSGNSNIRLITKIIDEEEKLIAVAEKYSNIPLKESQKLDQKIIIKNPRLWSLDSPILYKSVSEVYSDGDLTDSVITFFGIRSIDFSAEKGFLLNGLPVKLKGGCVHHDNGPLGARAYDRAEERRIELLKANGFNAIRCAHNPPSPSFLDACDRIGMLVIDEAFDMWRIGNNPYDYHLYFDQCWEGDIESLVMRDINHPSVIFWSIGNEIKDMENPEVIEVQKMLVNKVHSLDVTRPVTAAVNNLRPEKDVFFNNLDICGYNYAAAGDHGNTDLYLIDHLRVPDRVMMGTESYALAAFESWIPVVDNSYIIGDFVWTAFDYMGEASIGWLGYLQEDFYPWNLAYCGDIDICGWKRPQSYYRDALWKDNQLSLFITPPFPTFPLNPRKESWSKWEWHDAKADWNWSGFENKPLKVTAYSSCTSVELFLNSVSLGKKETDRETKFMAEWSVPYKAGELKAVGYNGKKVVASSILRTAGEVSSIKLSPDRKEIKADNQDLSFITVELTDSNGILNPKADNLVKFSITGEGSIIAVGNANPVSKESCQSLQRKAWNGRCLVIVKSNGNQGTIKISASIDRIGSCETIIVTK